VVFSSDIFVFIFLPITLFLYFLSAKKIKASNLILVLASLIFYSWGGLQYCLLLIFSTIVNYVLGILLEDKRDRKKIFLIIALIFNLGILCVFKYANFIFSSVITLLKTFGINIAWELPNIALPIGISFFTFQILSYVIDVYRGKVKAQRDILNLELYIMLFPQLIAGPIVRYIDIEKEIENRTFDLNGIYTGLRRFCIGFSKKVLLANQVAIVADAAFNYEWGLHPVYAWIGAAAYMLQIYLDFSAYSDMAIGLGRVFGFHFNENFIYPYISVSIREFWRRWHISLSTWFRDYVYIPLGGNRKGNKRTYINLLIVFFLTGLWHGASWNFVIWGLYHGCFMLLERKTNFCAKIPKVISWIYTIFAVLIGWVLFRADTLSDAIRYIGYMFNIHAGSITNVDIIRKLDGEFLFFAILSVLASTPLLKNLGTRWKCEWIKDVGILFVFLIAICYMVASEYNPFIYFRF